MKLLNTYQKARDAIYKHVGFDDRGISYPIEDCTYMFWFIDTEYPASVVFYERKENITIYRNRRAEAIADWKHTMYDEQEYYQEEIFTLAYHDKEVYEGKEMTMIFCETGMDEMRLFRVFDNKKRVTL